MKKKFVRVLLLLCLMIPLFSASAWAAKDYTPYIVEIEVGQGDTISDICDSYSIDYYAVKQAILVVNGMGSEDALNAVHPGQKLYIPKSRADADSIMALYNATVSAVIPESYVIKYTVEKGDTLYSICDAYQLDYNTCQEAIKSLNLWSGDFRLNSIYVGQEILLPATNEAAREITETVAKAVDANVNVSTTSGDRFEYYLIAHTMQQGETVRGVCDTLGLRYSNDVEQLLKTINGLSDLSRVQAGKDYLFPARTANNAVYAVYSHVVVMGDTTGNLCAAYNVKYEAVKTVLQGLNPKITLNAIPKGATMMLVAPCGTGAETPLIIK